MNDQLNDFLSSDPFGSWWPFAIALIVGVITTVRAYFGGPCCPSDAKIPDRTILITGGSGGIGLKVVEELIKRGGRIIVGSRNPEAASKAISKEIGKENMSKVVIKHLDLSSLKSVRDFVEKLEDEPKIDILINNAGVAFQEFKKTEEGFETHLVTNYLSHFLLIHLLLKKLQAAEDARIINVSAQAHYAGDLNLKDLNMENYYNHNKAFCQSKLALVLMTRHMSKILKGANITINAMHPGIVRNTKQFQNTPICTSLMMRIAIAPWSWLLMKTPREGAQTIIYMAVASELRKTSGKYFSNCKKIKPSEKVFNEIVADKLYQKSLELTGVNTKELEDWIQETTFLDSPTVLK